MLYESEDGSRSAQAISQVGIEQNTEMFFVRRLRYDEPAAATMLRDFDGYLGECAELAGTPSAQLDAIRLALQNRIRDTTSLPDGELVDAQFVSSFGGRLLDCFERSMPAGTITRGRGSPFFEQDDSRSDMSRFTGPAALLNYASAGELDIGLRGMTPASSPPSYNPSLVTNAALWAWRRREGQGRRDAGMKLCETRPRRRGKGDNLGPAVPTDVTPRGSDRGTQLESSKPWSRAEHSPMRPLPRTSGDLWLNDDRDHKVRRHARRPLHAKAMTVRRCRRSSATLPMGSANA